MANYGIGYMGSKNDIIDRLAKIFPPAKNFYDLFGGGFAVTHFMLVHRANVYERFFFNEIRSMTCDLIKDAILGKYNYDVFKPKFISREEFFQKKDTDPYIRFIWSFGNNQIDYLFSKELEPIKRSLHNAVVFNQFDDFAIKVLKCMSFKETTSIKARRLYARKPCAFAGRYDPEQLEQLLQLERLQRLQRLQQLEQLERLEITSKSFEQIKILPDSVLYCDPPYAGTAGYDLNFDHEAFWRWARAQTQPVFISEYSAPSDFKVIAAFNRNTKLSPLGKTKTKPEKLFGNKAAQLALKRRMP